MKRVALVTESSARKEVKMKAKEFFQGPNNQWVNKIIRYLEVAGISEENSYFLSFYKHRIIQFNEIIGTYPKYEERIKASEAKEFARKIIDFLLKFQEKPFVELHMGKLLYVPLVKLLDEYGFSYKIFAEGVPLGQKPKAYEELIEKENQILKAKEIQRGSWKVVSSIEYQSPAEAKKILEEYESVASLYGVEDIFQELKDYMTKHYKRNKEKMKALNEFEEKMNKHPDCDELIEFINEIKTVQDLFKNITRYERYKSKFGKELAKFTTYMIKQGYVVEIEKHISSILFKLSVVMLKRVA